MHSGVGVIHGRLEQQLGFIFFKTPINVTETFSQAGDERRVLPPLLGGST